GAERRGGKGCRHRGKHPASPEEQETPIRGGSPDGAGDDSLRLPPRVWTRRENQEATATVSPARRDQTKGGKVLVVDDEPTEREGLARMVGQGGYEGETASAGEEAL